MAKAKLEKVKNEPLVCICIVNWNGGQVTMNCLSSLFNITKYKNYKVILVDNGSTDGSKEKIKKSFPEVDLIESSTNLGYTGGMNYGWTHTLANYNPRYICNMNNDIVTIQPEWLSIM